MWQQSEEQLFRSVVQSESELPFVLSLGIPRNIPLQAYSLFSSNRKSPASHLASRWRRHPWLSFPSSPIEQRCSMWLSPLKKFPGQSGFCQDYARLRPFLFDVSLVILVNGNCAKYIFSKYFAQYTLHYELLMQSVCLGKVRCWKS